MKIFEDLNGFVSIWTVQRWCKMVNETGFINLSYSTGRLRIIRTKGMIQKVKNRMNRKKQVSIRKLTSELDISNGSVVRILKQDLGYRSYKKRVEPALTDLQKSQRLKLANWVRHNFRKEDTLKILFSDEKMFDNDEFGHQINWVKVQSKKTLIDELKRAVKRIRESVVLESCQSWTNRLYRLSKSNGNYLK